MEKGCDTIFTDDSHLVFKDILAQRRRENDISWIAKSFHPKKVYSRHKYSSNPLACRYEVLIDEDIFILLQKVFPYESTSRHFQRINDIVNEIGFLKNINVVRWLGLILIKIIKRIMQSVFVTETRFLKLRSTMGKNPVIFLPTHRSYADFILMAFLCFNYDIEIPVVVAGMDFYTMFGVSMLLRRCGAMYMRRSFKDDKIYGAVFKKYVKTIISNNDSPFEFFMEGTRSRCGKSLMPKLGLLKMVVEVFFENVVEDITFVPISINYDRLIEDVLFVREVLGIPKPKESTTGLLKGISLLEEQYGNIYINVGNEISLKEFHYQCQAENLLPHLAHTLIRSQQENTLITYFNMLSAVILYRTISKNCNLFSVPSLLEDLAILKGCLNAFRAYTCSYDYTMELTRVLSIHKLLIKNTENGTICIPDIFERDEERKDVMRTAMTVILLQHYANPCYYFIASPAALIMILETEKNLNTDSLFFKYQFFRLIFKHEFLFDESFAQQDFESASTGLQKLNLWRITDEHHIVLANVSNVNYMWCYLMLPYLKGYLFICKSLLQVKTRSFDKSRLGRRIRKQLELQLEISDDVSLFYALSSEFMSNTFASLVDADVLKFDRCTNSIRVADLEKLNTIVSFLKLLLKKYERDNVEAFTESIVCKL